MDNSDPQGFVKRGLCGDKYVSLIFSMESELSDIVLEIMERIFTMNFYSDDVIESACSIALKSRIFNVVDFNLLVCEIQSR